MSRKIFFKFTKKIYFSYAFRAIYRHGEDYSITDAELVAENSSATKQQERDAIEKIKAIFEMLGPQSAKGHTTASNAALTAALILS